MKKIIMIFAIFFLVSACSSQNTDKAADRPYELLPELNLEWLYPVNIVPDMSEITSGYIDKNGAWAFPDLHHFTDEANYNYRGSITSELLKASTKNDDAPYKTGFINRKGEWEIAPQYDAAYDFHDGMAYVYNGNYWNNARREDYYIDSHGNRIIDCTQFQQISPGFSEGLAWAIAKNSGENALGYINKLGEWVIAPSLANSIVDDLYNSPIQSDCNFHDGLALAKLDNKYGYIDRNGAWVIAPEYDNALAFSEGLGAVCKDDKWGFVNKEKQIQIALQYDYVYWFSEGLAGAFNGLRWGFIDTIGQWVIEPQFMPLGFESPEYIRFNRIHLTKPCVFYNGLAIVRESEKDLAEMEADNKVGKDYLFGYINKGGQWVILPRFSVAYPFNGELASVGQDVDIHNRGGTKGYIDQQANWIKQWDGW